MAHSMAVISDHVVAEVIEVQEFPELGSTYNVRGVPLTVINEKISFTGAGDEAMLVEHINAALDKVD